MTQQILIQSFLSSKGIRWISLGWIGFILENLILSENRTKIIELFGDDNYHLTYSTLSTIACGSIFYGYIVHGRMKGPTISSPTLIRKVNSFILQTLGLIGISQTIPLIRMPYTYDILPSPSSPTDSSISPSSPPTSTTNEQPVKVWRCPMDFQKRGNGSENDVYGMERITRHVVFWSFGLLTLSKAITTIYLPEVVMFTFPSIFAYIGGSHQDHRFLKNSGGTLSLEKYNKTSNVPFLAILTGKQSIKDVANEVKVTNMSIALGMSLLIGAKRFLR